MRRRLLLALASAARRGPAFPYLAAKRHVTDVSRVKDEGEGGKSEEEEEEDEEDEEEEEEKEGNKKPSKFEVVRG